MSTTELVELPDLGEQSALPPCRTDGSASDTDDMPTAVVTICGRHSRPIQEQRDSDLGRGTSAMRRGFLGGGGSGAKGSRSKAAGLLPIYGGLEVTKPQAVPEKQGQLLDRVARDLKAVDGNGGGGSGQDTNSTAAGLQCLQIVPDVARSHDIAATYATQLMKALAPTEEVMHSVLNDPDLLAGFDDPDVMAAVTDIAVDPRRAVKYQDNPKVAAFYRRMGNFAAQRCQQSR